MNDSKLAELQNKIGYKFKNLELLIESLSHSSLNRKVDGIKFSNERLEFFGDRILGFIVSDLLYSNFPTEQEGDLTHRYTDLVCKDTLSKIADELILSKYIYSHNIINEENKASIQSDALESLIAAIYLDGGIKSAYNFVEQNWNIGILNKATVNKNAKSLLQEWIQEHNHKLYKIDKECKMISLPRYTLLERTGTEHQPVFLVKIEIDNLEFYDNNENYVVGLGSSKQKAQVDAAKKFIKKYVKD